MSDFYEIDFLNVGTTTSGDAIAIRYSQFGTQTIHVVDGGYVETGDKVVRFIRDYYGNPSVIDAVVATHPDGDHAGGLRTVLEEFEVRALYMHRPWLYADELIHRFSRFTNVDRLKQRLRELYPNIAKLEEIAFERGIPMYEAFQGTRIGAFTVMTPTRDRYLDLVVDSDRTPEAVRDANLLAEAQALGKSVLRFLSAAWGDENFSPNDTSAENEMSIVQYADLQGDKILLTADTGRAGFREAADYAPFVGLNLPGINKFQIPHHGSRRNLSSELLDDWLGPKLSSRPQDDSQSFSAYLSAAANDPKHPRKVVLRAIRHRGGQVFSTQGQNLWTHSSSAPDRSTYSPMTPLSYPEDQESD